MKKTILIGDRSHYNCHPITNIENNLPSILGPEFTISISEDYISFVGLDEYDLCILYNDRWDYMLTDAECAGMLTFVANGGGLLIIHNGISVCGRREMMKLSGAKYEGHPERCRLSFINAAPEHPIMAGISEFTLNEEPYQYVFDNMSGRRPLMKYKCGKYSNDAGWIHTCGLGRIVYLMPGHDSSAFDNEQYRRIISKSAKWATKLI